MAQRIAPPAPMGQKKSKEERKAEKLAAKLEKARTKPRRSAPIKSRPKSRSAAKRTHIEAVKRMPCAVCGAPGPSDAHHAICDRYSQRRAPDTFCVPLCKDHHQNGPEAIHQDKTAWVRRWGPDWAFLPSIYAALGQSIPADVAAFIKERTDALQR